MNRNDRLADLYRLRDLWAGRAEAEEKTYEPILAAIDELIREYEAELESP
jgi:hypothetical protein